VALAAGDEAPDKAPDEVLAAGCKPDKDDAALPEGAAVTSIEAAVTLESYPLSLLWTEAK
jgi:hypothetical protein